MRHKGRHSIARKTLIAAGINAVVVGCKYCDAVWPSTPQKVYQYVDCPGCGVSIKCGVLRWVPVMDSGTMLYWSEVEL